MLVASAPPAWAHGLGSRGDLPLPLWMFVYGAAAALLISFVGLAVFWRRPHLEDPPSRVILRRGRLTGSLWVVTRAIGLGLLAVVLGAAAFGDSDTPDNIAPVFVYVVFWVGLIMASLVGDVWHAFNPFDTLARVCERFWGKPKAANKETGDLDPAYRLGRWPAAAGLLAFTWLELVYPDRAQPRTLSMAISIYVILVLGGVARWGRGWLRYGEAFTVFFGLLSHMAPIYRDEAGDIRARPPFAGLTRLQPDAGTEAVVLIALGSTSFDGLSRTRFWADLTRNYSQLELTLISTVGLLWAISVVAVACLGAMRVAARLQAWRPADLELSFVHSLVPIALAYAVAHYFSLLVFEGQTALALLSDPFGRGWNLFGTAGNPIDFTAVSTTTIAFVQAGAIIAGHVAGVVVAHDRALVLFKARDATRSQYPLLAAMVLFTVGGLALLLGA